MEGKIERLLQEFTFIPLSNLLEKLFPHDFPARQGGATP